MLIATVIRTGILIPACTTVLLVGCATQTIGSAETSGAPPLSGQVLPAPPVPTNPRGAREWRRLAWLDERGEMTDGGLRRALAQRAASLSANNDSRRGAGQTIAGSDVWIERGPYNVAGRTRSLLVDPDDPSRLWSGAVGGGLWRSDDAGQSWHLIEDWWDSLAVNCLAFDPTDSSTIYAGTGEGYYNVDAIRGVGIFKSTDGGQNWAQLESTVDWRHVNRIAVSHENPQIVLASVLSLPGIRRSDDGGLTWSITNNCRGSFSIEFDPFNASNVVASCLNYDFDAGHWYQYPAYSADGGVTWTPATGGVNHMQGYLSRIEVSYAPGDPSIVYASCATDDGRIWRSTDGGASYTLRSTGESSRANWYTNPLWVDPFDSDMLLTGYAHALKSMDGGVTFERISDGYIMTDQPHWDIHEYVQAPGFETGENRRVYIMTDGGVWVTDNIDTASMESGWTALDETCRSTQYYGVAGHGPSGLLIGGTQDNGTLRLTMDSGQAVLTFGGDGGFCAIDPDDPLYTYGEHVKLRLHRSTDGGLNASYIHSGIAEAGGDANFIAPFMLDPNESDTLLAGGRSLWRSVNVKAETPSWQVIRGPVEERLCAIAVAEADSDVIWVGENGGVIERTTNGTSETPTWITVDDNGGTSPLPDRFISRIFIDADDPQTVYVALGGFTPDNLWRTTDGGVNWTDISGTGETGLPEAPVRGFTRHPGQADWLYAGTEVGVFASTDGGATWSTSRFGPASVVVDELVFMHDSATLLAATHGRGLFTLDLGVAGDVNGDGSVGFADLVTVLASWGDCAGCPADINGDGVVDFADLLEVLANWS